jgi:hypothetical protein
MAKKAKVKPLFDEETTRAQNAWIDDLAAEHKAYWETFQAPRLFEPFELEAHPRVKLWKKSRSIFQK